MKEKVYDKFILLCAYLMCVCFYVFEITKYPDRDKKNNTGKIFVNPNFPLLKDYFGASLWVGLFFSFLVSLFNIDHVRSGILVVRGYGLVMVNVLEEVVNQDDTTHRMLSKFSQHRRQM